MKQNHASLVGCFIRKYRGASADLPVFRSNADGKCGKRVRYMFDTYGLAPANVDKWHPKLFGTGGAYGYTANVNDLVCAIKAMNDKGLSAPICETLWDECIAFGATEVETRECQKPNEIGVA